MTALLAAHDHDVSDLGVFGWIAVGLAALFVAWVLWRAVVLTLRPGEEDPDHIKRSILQDDVPPAAPEDGAPPEATGRGPTDPARGPE